MSIIQYASPEARYYKYDRDIMEDYDNRINIYNKALGEYQTQAGEYQTKVDAHNALVNQYNADLEAWREKANAYNDAIAAWNQTDRTTPYDQYSGYAPSPGEWVGTAPVFEGGSAPVAPTDPGFGQGDVDAFIKEAQARAVRRGNAGATAQAVMSSPGQFYSAGRENFGSTPEVSLAGMSGFGSSAMGFDEGGIVPPPVPTEEDLARAAAVEDTGRGIGYYIPPELQEKGRQFMNLASALDPAQGIMRGMAASGRAFDESLTPEQRREAGIEAALETLAPAGMIGMGALAKQPAKAVLMDILTPTGATKDIAEDTLGDPSRRAFLKGAAATAGVAAIAPDIVMEASEAVGKATKAATRARINPLDMAVANIKELRRQIDEQYEILDELEGLPVGQANKDAQVAIETANFEIIDEVFDAIIGLKPEEFSEAVKNIPDDALETLIEPQYESIMGNQRLVDDGENSVRLAEEVKRRGMHLAKDENGIDRFPNARAYFEDFEDPVSARESLLNYRNEVIDNPSNLNMVRETPSDLTQEIDAMRIRNMYRTMEDEILKMRDMGRTEAEIEAYRTAEQARINEAQGLPSDMDDFFAQGGAVAMKFDEGGMVPGLAFTDSIKPMSMARIPFSEMPGYEGPEKIAMGPSIKYDNGMSSQDLVPMGGIGGLFQNQFQQYGSQMADLQGSPLKNYQNYLMNTYGSRAMENMQQNVQEDVGEFVDLVDQAERAHFGAEESYGFGGGEYHQGLLDQFQNNLPQPINQLTGGFPKRGEEGSFGGLVAELPSFEGEIYGPSKVSATHFSEGPSNISATLFSEGGAVTAITEENLTAMRTKVMEDYGFDPVDIAMEEGVDPELFLRLMYTENRGRQGPVSEAGAIGLTQLMPQTAAELGVDPNVPIENARGGARYLRQQLETFQSVPLALAAYNAGPGNVRKYGGVPPFEETRNYVAMIHGVDTAEILPNMNEFYTRVEGEDPSRKPQLRPEGFGTESYVPPQPVQSEYLMSGVGGVFSGMQEPQQEKQERPFIPNIMQRLPEEEEARGIEFYKQYAAYEMPG